MNAAALAAMSTSAPEPPRLPRYTIRALPQRGKWALLVDGVERLTGERIILETLMKRLQAVDAALAQHGIDPQSEPKEPKA